MGSPPNVEEGVTLLSDTGADGLAETLAALHVRDLGGAANPAGTVDTADTAEAADPPGGGGGDRDVTLAGIFDAIARETVDKKPTIRDRLSELPTVTRIAVGLGAALGVAVLALLAMGVRGDLSVEVLGRYAILLTGITGLVGVAMAVSLRGAHQPRMWRGRWVFAVLALATPVVLALLPDLWGGPSHGMAIPDSAPFSVHVPCMVLGLMTGGMVSAMVWLLQRDRRSTLSRVISAAGAGGLTAFAILQLNCPANDVTHLLVGHASVGLGLSVFFGGIAWFRRRSAP